jgi:hypothetical protein
VTRVRSSISLHYSWPSPLNLISFFFLNWTKFVNYENPTYTAQKFTKHCNLIEWKIWKNFLFWGQVQIQNIIWIKIPGSKTTFEFKLNLLEAQACLEKLVNSLKFLLALSLQNVNLDWYSCMEKNCSFHTSFIWLGLKIRKRGFEFEFKLNQVPLLWIRCNYKMKNCILCISCYSDTMGVTVIWTNVEPIGCIFYELKTLELSWCDIRSIWHMLWF